MINWFHLKYYKECDLFRKPLKYMKSKFQKGSIKGINLKFENIFIYYGLKKGSIFGLSTAMLGAGVLSLPLATMRSGIFFTILQLIICASLC